jgi:hypothetical protein
LLILISSTTWRDSSSDVVDEINEFDDSDFKEFYFH